MISGLFTLAALAAYLGICVWAWSRHNQARFAQAASMPLQDDDKPGDPT